MYVITCQYEKKTLYYIVDPITIWTEVREQAVIFRTKEKAVKTREALLRRHLHEDEYNLDEDFIIEEVSNQRRTYG